MLRNLAELPPPPPGKLGWPWTEPPGFYPPVTPGGQPWPRLTIITPSYNQAAYLEETIRSVLLQGYPDLEYMVIDGGSTDGSLEIIQRYAPWLDYWVSESDSGQAEAINKGLARLTGTVAAWINSDDIYLPNAWQAGISHLVNTHQCVLTYSDCQYMDESSQAVGVWHTRQQVSSDLLLTEDFIPQPTVLVNAPAWRQAGGMDERYRCILDFDLWVRLSLAGSLYYSPGCTASFRLHQASKTLSNQMAFTEEYLTWFAESPYLAGVQSTEQRLEALQRIHIRAAQAYLACGDTAGAGSHFREALQSGCWPYGSLESLAERLAYSQSHQERLGQLNRARWSALHRALRAVVPRRLGEQLWRRVVSLTHIQSLFRLYKTQTGEARTHFFKGIYYNPGWLRNRGVLSIGVELFLGQRFTGWLRRLI